MYTIFRFKRCGGHTLYTVVVIVMLSTRLGDNGIVKNNKILKNGSREKRLYAAEYAQQLRMRDDVFSISCSCFCPAQLADRHHRQTRIVRQQTELAVGHERGVVAAGQTDAAAAADVRRPVADVAVVPVPVTGTAEHVARAHRRVPPRRTTATGVRQRRRDRQKRLVLVVRVFAGHRRPQLRHVVGRRGDGAQTVVESAAATPKDRGDHYNDHRGFRGKRRRHEEIRVRLVRNAAGARQATRVSDEHAGTDVARTSETSGHRRPNTRGTLKRLFVSFFFQ